MIACGPSRVPLRHSVVLSYGTGRITTLAVSKSEYGGGTPAKILRGKNEFFFTSGAEGTQEPAAIVGFAAHSLSIIRVLDRIN